MTGMMMSSSSYDRARLLSCQHYVARCDDCELAHHLWELAAERLCARCHRDLTPELRRHATECPDAGMRPAAVGAAVGSANGDGARSRGRAADGPAPGGAARHAASPVGRTSGCPLCAQMVEPGEPVSFRFGRVCHLRCYEATRRATP